MPQISHKRDEVPSFDDAILAQEESYASPNSEVISADIDLVQRILQRDAQAIQSFYDTYAPGLLRRLYRLLGDQQDAEDGLQNVFMEALRSLPNYRGEGPLGAWLNRIASHTAMDLLRRRHRWRGFIERVWEDRGQLSEQEAPLPDALFAEEETKQLVWNMIQQLSPQKRMAIVLCDIEGGTIQASAEALKIPQGTFISRLYSGRRELKKLLERESQRQGLTPGSWFNG